MTETATSTIDTADHWQWVRDLIDEATGSVETETPATEDADSWLRTSTGYAIPPAPTTPVRKPAARKTANCRRCHALLTSGRSVVRGIGRTCERNERRERIANEAGYKPHQLASALELIEDGAIVAGSGSMPGLFVAVSSDGSEFYEVTVHTCGCPAFENGRNCYHRLAATLLAA